MQKILYYIQKEFLKVGRVLFNDDFEAWAFGPVIPEVYYQYCGFGAIEINMCYDIKLHLLGNNSLKIIDNIIEEKRSKQPWELVEEIHSPDGAWSRTYHNRSRSHFIIFKDEIMKYG